jgi:hypothetical protein
MDLAVYKNPVTPDSDETSPQPSMIIETKQLFSDLGPGLDQDRSYSEIHGCNGGLVSTDGVRYLVEDDDDAGVEGRKQAYMNLLRLRGEHPYDVSIHGAPEVLGRLLRS